MLTLEVSVARAALIWLMEMGLIVALVIIFVIAIIGIAWALGIYARTQGGWLSDGCRIATF
jgi:hypothetical protein